MPHELANQIARTIDLWHAAYPHLTVMDVLKALEEVRHTLTESFIDCQMQEKR